MRTHVVGLVVLVSLSGCGTEGAAPRAPYDPSSRPLAPILEGLEEVRPATERGTPPNVRFTSWGTIRGLDMHVVLGGTAGAPPEQTAMAFVTEIRDGLGISDPAASLAVDRVRPVEGGHVVRLRQHVGELPVWGATATIAVDTTGTVTDFHGVLVPESVMPALEPLLDRDQAATRADMFASEEAVLGIWNPETFANEGGHARLAWKLRDSVHYAYVDAHDGTVLTVHDILVGDLHREVYVHSSPALGAWTLELDDVCHTSSPPRCTTYADDNPLCPTATASCVWGLCIANAPNQRGIDIFNHVGTFDNYLQTRHGRDAWDNNPAGICDRYMVEYDSVDNYFFSPCDGHFDPLRKAIGLGIRQSCLDVVAHEWTHAVDSVHAGIYQVNGSSQAAIMSEAIPDIFGELVERFQSGVPTDWVHGTGCGDPNTGETCRTSSLRNPTANFELCPGQGTFPQPDHYSQFRACGKYFSGTIVSKAAFLLGREPSEPVEPPHYGLSVTPIGEVKTSQLLFHCLTQNLGQSSLFIDLSQCMINRACSTLPAADCQSTKDAFDAVGIWRPSSYQGWSVSAEVSAARSAVNTVNGWQERIYLAYQKPGVSGTFYRYQIPPNTGWSSELSLGYTFSSPISSAAFEIETFVPAVWTCGRTASSTIACRVQRGDAAPTETHVLSGPLTESRPSVATFNGSLYVFYRQHSGFTGANEIKYVRRYKPCFFCGYTWSSPVSTGLVSTMAPTAVSGTMETGGSAANGLWAFARQADGTIGYRKFTSDTDWGTTLIAGATDQASAVLTDTPVAAAMFRGRIHVMTRRGGAYDGDIWYMSCLATNCTTRDGWSRWVRQDPWANGVLYLTGALGDDQLNLWHRVPGENTLWRRFKRSE